MKLRNRIMGLGLAAYLALSGNANSANHTWLNLKDGFYKGPNGRVFIVHNTPIQSVGRPDDELVGRINKINMHRMNEKVFQTLRERGLITSRKYVNRSDQEDYRNTAISKVEHFPLLGQDLVGCADLSDLLYPRYAGVKEINLQEVMKGYAKPTNVNCE